MTEVEEIIDFIKTLKKGFDKDLFQSKIDELAYIVDNTGLVYDDFHTLFKVWLNLSIPVTKWVSLGSCLVPSDMVEERTVKYALRWILANFQNQSNFSRIGFLLDWLTVAMESGSIDMNALDTGYEVFYTMLAYDTLTVHAIKLVYTLTKPADVTRNRVLVMIDYLKKREGKKNMARQLQVLLGLFKSYKPECVPEDIPAVSIHTAFKKLNVALVIRFRRIQESRNRQHTERQFLTWINPLNSRNNKKAEPLVPDIMFYNNNQISDGREPTKNFLDFSDPVSLMQYSLQHAITRPARLRSLLCNAVGQTVLAVIPHGQQAFLNYDLHHLLNYCFFEISPYSYMEKQDLLQKLAVFQRTVVQGLPVVTKFIAQYLTFWNEMDFFSEILDLVEWVSVDCVEHVQHITDALCRVCLRSRPLEQCALIRALTNMYTNLVYSSTKTRQHFLNTLPSPSNYSLVLPKLAKSVALLCDKGLQVDPGDIRFLYLSIWSAQRRALAELNYGAPIGALPTPITLAIPLLSVSAALIDNMAELMILYNKNKSKNETKNEAHLETLSKYLSDLLNCLYSEEALSSRHDGLVFQKLHPQLVCSLECLIPDADAKLSIRNHLAFAPYTYVQLSNNSRDYIDADNKLFFKAVIEDKFVNLSRLLKKALPDLRYR